jgi:hypothetical protein
MHTFRLRPSLDAARCDPEQARRNLHNAVIALRRAGRILARVEDLLTGTTKTASGERPVPVPVRLEAVMSHSAQVQGLQRLLERPRDAPRLKEPAVATASST